MNIGFIGLGTMGSGIAANILKAGHTLTIHDLHQEAATALLKSGASWAETPKAVAKSSDIVFTCLPGPVEVEAIALGKDGIIEGIQADAAYIDLTSSSPNLVRRIYGLFKEKGADVMDSPMTGGPWRARDGSMKVMVGGDEAVFQRCKPVLDAVAAEVIYTGGIGTATICKLMHNSSGLCAYLAMAECLTLGVKAGVKPEVLWSIVKANLNEIVRRALPDTYFKGDFDHPTFKLHLALKDLDLATSLGREYDIPMMITNLAKQEFITALNRGWGDKDLSVNMLLQEERAGGVEVRFPDDETK